MYFYEFPRGSAAGWPIRRTLSALVLLSTTALAEPNSAPGESARAMPGLVRVGVPAPSSAPVVVAGSAGYGFLDTTSVLEGGHEAFAGAAVAYAPFPELSFGLDLSGRLDRYADPDLEERVKLYGEPRLTARFARFATERLAWGVELDSRFVGAEAPSIAPRATSPSLTGLVGFELSTPTWLVGNLGFHLDRSFEAVPDGANLGSADERTLRASSWSAFRWGLGASHRLIASKTELLGELSGDFLVGSATPTPSRSPSRLSVGARQPLSREFSLLVHADVSLSRRPLVMDDPEILPIEPRVAVGAALIWRLGVPEPAPEVKPEPPPEPPEPAPTPEPTPAVPASPVQGSIVDEGGRPLPDAEVTLAIDGQPDLVAHSTADGRFEFPEVPEGSCRVSVSAPGYDPVVLELGSGEERTREIVLHESVPAGQLRGRVLDLQGAPLRATLSVEPSGQVVEAQGDGSFDLELSPGRYTVTFRHEGFAPQKRKITVTNRGVVILDIALTR